MQPVRSVKNQYCGINAHLHSYWQNVSGWTGFHTLHIGHLAVALEAQLLPLGYTAEIEPSLQIRRGDVGIFDADPIRARFSIQPRLQPSSAAATLTLPITLAFADYELSERPYPALAIRQSRNGNSTPEPLVAWLELLSPANKGNHADARKYRDKRHDLMQDGVVFVEIDYLHESPATLQILTDYSRLQPASEARPYRILVIDPRPEYETGKVYVHQFAVDEPIPTVQIPLNAEDVLDFDFSKPYQRSFEELHYGLKVVDYTQFPLRFERYSTVDQGRIANRMVAVLHAAREGIDLETAPFPVETLALDDALNRIEQLHNEKQNTDDD